jgi:hypothetical protein
VIDSNEIDFCTLGFSEALTLDGNIVGFVISNNVIHDNNNIGIKMLFASSCVIISSFVFTFHLVSSCVVISIPLC